MKSESALKLSLSPTRAPQDIIITVVSLGWIKDTKMGGKSTCMNCYQGEYNNKHSSSQYTYIFHARAEIGSHIQVPRVVMRVVCNDDDNPIKTVPAKKISAGSWWEKVHLNSLFEVPGEGSCLVDVFCDEFISCQIKKQPLYRQKNPREDKQTKFLRISKPDGP